eukprot:CAMPEP_0177669752 /NCGR_PEP_ID=MMETSP0447-20121125/23654_1 /TAXON_ID=0 /ORGANISM="Stygamoeba regulata, Strain BSH-02190019" /LENGTH=278 /DNA_ID=CAMNT_0019176731 /DNA_START=132 /DNA_END=967 /DNA_ORIENTATION=-
MDTLAMVKARTVAIAGGTVATTSILTCYFTAVALGHVPLWLPMISDCGVEKPERYLFRFGLVTSALLLCLNSFIMLLLQKSDKWGPPPASNMDEMCVVVASVSCLALAVVGVVNEREDDAVHSTAAVIFFAGYLIYEILTICRIVGVQPRVSPAVVLGMDGLEVLCAGEALVLTAFTAAALVGYVVFAILSQNTLRALCEWLGVLGIVLFNMSFTMEYADELFLTGSIVSRGTPDSAPLLPAQPVYYYYQPHAGYAVAPAVFPAGSAPRAGVPEPPPL